MTKKEKMTTEDTIISAYMNHVLEHNEDPKSIYSFCKHNDFEEAAFYKFFTSFEIIKRSVFSKLFEQTLTIVTESDDYKNFDSRNQLLTFYFSFFEMLTANRSYFVYALEANKGKLENLKILQDLRKYYKEYITQLDLKTFAVKSEKLSKFQDKAVAETAWIQLLMTMKFWLDDSSAAFEKTDLYIEKSVNASFDLLNTIPLESVLDFGKFLVKEKMMRK
jgi:hypothetical protein